MSHGLGDNDRSHVEAMNLCICVCVYASARLCGLGCSTELVIGDENVNGVEEGK